ncbi:hypothetical protein [Cellulomonas iranensis]|uniref:Uncharacterized protein n=1 Tax=Cellulomonas iranensis TaxID=76862 RepID=A0ABU0GG22_9CELL|nr:hypothetical protein [Cellulomonas iranensis]MDQ0423879.1 hypothetical protein [Cellulomonas iranensis]
MNLSHLRGRAGWLALAAVLVLVAGLALTARSLWPTRADASTDPPTVAANSSTSADPCEASSREGCRSVRLSNGSQIRYVVLKSDDAQLDRAVVVDPGGPGLSILGAQWPDVIDDHLQAALEDRPLVLVEEPWVTRQLPETCRQALRAWFTATHRGTQPGDLVGPCEVADGQWGWTPQAYAEVLDSIAAQEGLSYEGFVGVSFGAHRFLYDAGRFQWAALANPAPVHISGDQYLATRANGVWQMAARVAGGSLADLSARVTARAAGLAAVEIDGRSTPVTGTDLGAAAIALTYQHAETQQLGVVALLEDGGDPSLIGSLADLTWMRYGENDISPAYLAYLDEVCVAYGPWTPPPGADVVREVLDAMHRPCSDVAETGQRAPVTSATVCVSHAVDDPVAPEGFAATWAPVGQVIGRDV